MIGAMNSIAESLKHAELMLRGTGAERAEACATLRKIVEDNRGTPYAADALRLLEGCEGRNTVEPKDSELLEFSRRWEEIHGLTHVGLLKFLKDLSQKPAVAARLRSIIIRDLGGWLADEVPRVDLHTPPDKLKALDRFIATISELKTYANDLEELKPLRGALFQIRLSEAGRRIRAALQVWFFDEAWAAFQTLSKPLVSFEDEVKRLQDEIYRVDRGAPGGSRTLGHGTAGGAVELDRGGVLHRTHAGTRALP